MKDAFPFHLDWNVLHLQVLREWEMYIVLCLFLVVDIIVLTVWQIIDPLYRELESFPHELPKDTDKDIQLKPQLEHCSSRYLNVWLGECLALSILKQNIFNVRSEIAKQPQITLTGSLNRFPKAQRNQRNFSFLASFEHSCCLPSCSNR